MLSRIFKAYDVRGIYGKDLTEDIAYQIGRAFVHFLKCDQAIVGYDMRLSSPELSKGFMRGITAQGADAIDIGQVSTDGLYFASGSLKLPGVMFTASHNPKEYNGIKFCKSHAVPINQNTGLKEIKSIIEEKLYETNDRKKIQGKIVKKNILPDYVNHVNSFIHKTKINNLKVAVDAGNGMAGKIIPLVYGNIPVKIVKLYFKLDGNFPNHPADPSKYQNLKELQKIVTKEKCNFGIAFDGDADRVFFIDEKGNIVNSSILSCLIIKNILDKNPGEKVIYNLVCSRIVPETIEKYGGVAHMERVGHSFIKETMRKINAVFACEHSAHYYFRKNFNADSGIIASLLVTEIVSKENKPFSELLKEFEKYYKIEETNFKVDDKELKLKRIKNHYKKLNPKKIMELDGLSIYFDNWWFNVRPSNTEPLLRLNLEAFSQIELDNRKLEITKLISNDN